MQADQEGRDGLDSGDKKQEAEEDGPALHQAGRSENGPEGGVARRQSPGDPEHRGWKRAGRVRDMRGKDA